MKLRSGKLVNYRPIQKKDKKITDLCNLFKKVELRDEIDDLIISIYKTKISNKKKIIKVIRKNIYFNI